MFRIAVHQRFVPFSILLKTPLVYLSISPSGIQTPEFFSHHGSYQIQPPPRTAIKCLSTTFSYSERGQSWYYWDIKNCITLGDRTTINSIDFPIPSSDFSYSEFHPTSLNHARHEQNPLRRPPQLHNSQPRYDSEAGPSTLTQPASSILLGSRPLVQIRTQKSGETIHPQSRLRTSRNLQPPDLGLDAGSSESDT